MSYRLIARSLVLQSRTCFKLAETRGFASIIAQGRSNLSTFQKISRQSKAIRSPQIRLQSSQTPKPKEKKAFIHITWKSVIVVAIFGGALLIFKWKLEKDKEEAIKRQRKQTIGKMAIGGEFDLINQDGKPVSSKDFRGKWMLIYFGFTHCPDICPEELEKLIKTVSLVKKVNLNGQEILPLFITVDPERDDVKAVSKYVKEFSPDLIGLTGSKEQIEQVTRAYRVYFSQGPKDEDKDYIVDHTVITYLVNPDGEFVDYYGQNKKADEIASAIAIHMGSYGIRHKNSDKK